MHKILSAFILIVLLMMPAMAEGDTAQTKAPKKEWVLSTLDGDTINIGEHINTPGNRIMVFWASWCPYCAKLMPIVNDLKRDYPEMEVMSFNVFDENMRIEDYPTEANWPFTHILNGDEFARVHGVKGLPTLFLINDQGKMVLDLREIDTSSSNSMELKSSRQKANQSAPLWDKGLRKALDQLNWD